MNNTNTALGKAVVGGGGAGIANSHPSNYFDVLAEYYDIFGWITTGEDLARLTGLAISVLVGGNIIFNWIKDFMRWKQSK